MSPIWVTFVRGGPRRVNHAAAALDSVILSFGGYCSNIDDPPDQKIDIHVFGTNTLQWRKLELKPEDNEDAPSIRYGHTAVSYNGKIFVWGGRKNEIPCNQLFMFENYKWSKPKVQGTIPSSRDGHTACIVGNKMYVFGGFDDDRFCTGLYSLNLDTFTWKKEITQGTEPECRDFHAVAVVGTGFYLFGGRSTIDPPFHVSQDTYPNGLFHYDSVTATWTKLRNSMSTPVGRRSLSMVAHGTNLYIFGGYNETYKKHFNDLHCYDTITGKWSEITPKGTCPSPRRRHASVIINDRIYIFGGTSPRSFNAIGFEPDLLDCNDLYILDIRPTLRTLALYKAICSKIPLSTISLPIDLYKEFLLHKKLATNFKIMARQHFISTAGGHAVEPDYFYPPI